MKNVSRDPAATHADNHYAFDVFAPGQPRHGGAVEEGLLHLLGESLSKPEHPIAVKQGHLRLLSALGLEIRLYPVGVCLGQ